MPPRHTFLAALLLAPLTALHAADAPKPATAKAPFRVLYSDDTTHIGTCVSPYNAGGQPFGPEMIEAAVDETAGTGIEVHLLQPGLGAVPWWKSQTYPFREHVKFMKERFGAEVPKGDYAAYMAGGGDMVEVFTGRCRKRDLVPFVSLRLNDGHGHEFVNVPKNEIPSWAWHVLTPMHVEHPEWRIGSNLNDWNQRSFNWTIPGVREAKLRFIKEICEQYPIGGFELDFMRHCSFFRVQETTHDQRVAIMVEFLHEVRRILDRTAPAGQRRWLCVRVPAFAAAHDAMGIDLAAWVRAGVDMVNLSYYYFTSQDGDLAAIRRQVPEAALYVEMCHATRVGAVVAKESSYDNFSFRRTTATQFYTTAHVAYARGLDGVSAFNFMYYRKHGVGPRGPFCEPPFEVFQHLGDRTWLARQPQHYFLAEVWDAPRVPNRALPKQFRAGQMYRFSLDMAPPTGGWTKPGRLRIQAMDDLADSRWTCRFNGQELTETADRSEPFANPYPALLGGPEQHRAWIVPAGLPKDGANQVEVTLREGNASKVVFLDVALP